MKDWRNILVSPDTTILQVLKIIDQGALQIALVVDEKQRLLGTITDGDVRRGILKGISFNSPIRDIMNPNPVVVSVHEDRESVLAKMKLKKIHQLPVLDSEGRVVNVEILDHLLQPRRYENHVVIMAGGLGTRLRPLTDDCPKPLLKIGNKPILETIIENFIEHGFYRFYLSVNYKAEMIQDYFGDGSMWGAEIRYICENKRLGTAGALSLISEKMDKPFIVMNGDLLTKVNFTQLLEYHLQVQSKATMCVREYDYQIPYGVVKVDKHRLVRIEEKPIQRFLVNAGIYVLDPETVGLIPKDTYYEMPSLFERIIEKGMETAVFPIREYWLDIGRMDDYQRANVEYDEVFK